MLSTILSVIGALPTIAKAVREVIALAWAIVRMFDKDPAKEQADKERQHEEGQKKAEQDDDTSGLLG